jgi:galactokinase
VPVSAPHGQATSLFEATFSTRPRAAASAPGRLLLLGDAAAEGEPAFAIAVERRTAVVAAPARTWEAVSSRDGVVDPFDPDAGETGVWTDHLAGVVQALRARDIRLPGARIGVATAVPRQAGFGAATALRVASAKALSLLAGHRLPEVEVAAAGANTSREAPPEGSRDATAIALGRRGMALIFDPGSAGVRWARLDARIWLIETGLAPPEGVTAPVGRQEEEALGVLREHGVRAERLADLESVDPLAWLPPPLVPRARFLLTEAGRIRRLAREGLSRGLLGNLMLESHAAAGPGPPEIECLVQAAQDRRALGARAVGRAGWGIALLVPPEREAWIVAEVAEEFRAAFGRIPVAWPTWSAAGVKVEATGR